MSIGQHGIWGKTIQIPREFAYLRDLGLAVKQIVFSIEPTRQPGRSYFQGVSVSLFPVFNGGKGMEVCDKKIRFIIFLL